MKKNLRNLISNFFALSTLQLVNFLLPLIIIPYLISTIGIERYGLLAFATATIMYFQVLTDYGFNLIGTRDISNNRNNIQSLSKIVCSIISVKIIFCFISLIILTFLILLFEKFRQDFEIFYLTFVLVIGHSLFPVWFFQGIERMGFITVLNVIAKITFTILIFIFVKNQTHTFLVPMFQAFGFLVSAILSLFILKFKFKISFKAATISEIKHYITDGFHIFISRAAVNFYTTGNILILGFLTNNTLVGYYSVAEKISNAGSILGSVSGQVIFPNLSKTFSENRLDIYNKKLNYTFLMIIIPSLIISIIFFSFPSFFIELLARENINESKDVLRILAITVTMIPLGGIFTQNLVIRNLNKYISKITLFTALFNLLLVFIMIKYFGIYGLAFTVVLVQIFQIIYNYLVYNKLKNNTCVV